MPWWGREGEVIGGCVVAKRWYENFSDTTVLVLQVLSQYGYRLCSVWYFAGGGLVAFPVLQLCLVVYGEPPMAAYSAVCSASCWTGFVAFQPRARCLYAIGYDLVSTSLQISYLRGWLTA